MESAVLIFDFADVDVHTVGNRRKVYDSPHGRKVGNFGVNRNYRIGLCDGLSVFWGWTERWSLASPNGFSFGMAAVHRKFADRAGNITRPYFGDDAGCHYDGFAYGSYL